MKRFIVMLMAVDWAITKRDLIRCAEHPYKSMFWRALGALVLTQSLVINLGLVFGFIHITG